MRRVVFMLLPVVVATTLAAALPAVAGARPSLVAYRGLGAWIDIYDTAFWNDPEGAVALAASHGVRTLFIETANYHTAVDASGGVYRPADLGRMIEAAHFQRMKVVAWYLPGFQDLGLDYRRSMAAIRFRTSTGQSFDSFGLDIEDSKVQPASKRSSRLLTLSRRIRSAVGAKYPLGAITPSAYGIRLRPTYWPGFPYKELMKLYDVIVPMGYFTYHGDGTAQAYSETVENIRILREECGPRVPIHLAGGIGDKMTVGEATSFVRAVRLHGLLGGSIYDMATTSASAWRPLAAIPANPLQRPVLPAPLPLDRPLGNIPGGDRSHPKEIFVTTGPLAAGSRLRVRLYDCQAKEVRLLVNWKPVRALPAGPRRAWSGIRVVTLPPQLLRPVGNVVGFVAKGSYPAWRTWGIRGLSIRP